MHLPHTLAILLERTLSLSPSVAYKMQTNSMARLKHVWEYIMRICMWAVESWSGEEGNDEHYVAHGFNRLPPRMKGADGVYACARVCLKFKFASQRAAVVVVVGVVVVGVFLLDVCYRSVFGAFWGDTLAPRLPTCLFVKGYYRQSHQNTRNYIENEKIHYIV